MRPFALVASTLAAVTLGCGDGPAASSTTSTTSLTITVWPQGKTAGAPKRTWTLKCTPATGTHPRPGIACQALFAHLGALRAVPSDRACIEVFGGPQVAEVRGTVRGKPVRAAFNRSNGCEIERWNSLKALFPVAV